MGRVRCEFLLIWVEFSLISLGRHHSNVPSIILDSAVVVIWALSITMMSYECHGISDHQLNCLFKSLFRLTTNTHQSFALLAFCKGNPPVMDGFPSTRPVMLCMRISFQVVASSWVQRFALHMMAIWAYVVSMMTSSNGNIFHITGPLCGNSPVTGEFPAQRPVMQSFDVFFDLGLNKWLSKQSRTQVIRDAIMSVMTSL